MTDGFHIATGFLGTPFVDRRADQRRRAGVGVRAAAAAGEPVLAVPGHDGRDDDLGALGLDAPGRVDQPRRDDVVQPLRLRRGRGLAAPHRRRSGAGRAGLPDGCGSLPVPGPGITSAAATHETPYGTAEVSWTRRAGPRSRSSSRCRRTRPRRSSCPTAAPPVEVGSGRHAFQRTIAVPAPVEKPASSMEPGMTTTSVSRHGEVGPPPPYDPECGAVLADLPEFPPLTTDSIPVAAGTRKRLHAAPDERGARPRRRVHGRGADRAWAVRVRRTSR